MSDDREKFLAVKSRSDDEIEMLAAHCREAANLAEPSADILGLITATAAKFKISAGLEVRVVDDDLLGKDDARASSLPPIIIVKNSVYAAAQRNDPRARMTLAHELGHIILEHKGGFRARSSAAVIAPTHIKAYEDAEHQAKFFAAGFLVPKTPETSKLSAQEIQLQFGVSKEAAEIRYSQINKRTGRSPSIETTAEIKRLHAIASEVERPSKPATSVLPPNVAAKLLWELLPTVDGEDPKAVRAVDGRWFVKIELQDRSVLGGWRVAEGTITAWEDERSR